MIRIAIAVFLILFPGFLLHSQSTGTIVINLHPGFGKVPLEEGKICYRTAAGDSISINLFKCYWSHLAFTEESKKAYTEPNSYHLLNTEEPESMQIRLQKVPVGKYNRFAYAIGVDSLMNVAGALDGDLDPIKGMYWTWNTGYIAAKLEGKSPSCQTPHQEWQFHIGGYLRPYSAFRQAQIVGTEIPVEAGKITELEVWIDLSSWFNASQIIDMKKIHNVVLPCKESTMIANNYAGMFSILKVSVK
jgi:hypothetical protein